MPSSYTEKEVQKMIDIYTANPCIETVERLMTVLNKPKRSIIAKLVKEGVYVNKIYRTKTGEIPVTKLEYVRSIEDALDLTLPGLDKAPKNTLKRLSRTIVEQTEYFEDALDQVQKLTESNRVLREMSNVNQRTFLTSGDDDFYDPISTLGDVE